jgi:hypothetical protein
VSRTALSPLVVGAATTVLVLAVVLVQGPGVLIAVAAMAIVFVPLEWRFASTRAKERAQRFGIGDPMPESYFGQLAYPFRRSARSAEPRGLEPTGAKQSLRGRWVPDRPAL